MQCSDKKKDQSTKIIKEENKKAKVKKKIQTVILYFDYSPDPVTWWKTDYPEYLWLLYVGRAACTLFGIQHLEVQ